MSKKWRLRANALLDGVAGTASVPSTAAVSYPFLSKYRRGQSDVERSWSFVGKYLEVAMQEYENGTEIDLQSKKAECRV